MIMEIKNQTNWFFVVFKTKKIIKYINTLLAKRPCIYNETLMPYMETAIETLNN